MNETDRLEMVRARVDEILLQMPDVYERRCAYLHLYGVAQACAMIAMKRGEQVELAMVAVMLHDLIPRAPYWSGSCYRIWHYFVKRKQSASVMRLFATARKEKNHLPFDEVLIDGDVWQRCLFTRACMCP